MERIESERDSLSDLFPTGLSHIVYSGAMGEKQKPIELFLFFELLCQERSDICCHIFSKGPVVDKLRNGNRGNRICFHDLVPEDQLFELYNRSDVQIVPQAEGTGAGAFPSKLPNIIAMGVPILAICDQSSELAKIIVESAAGRVVSGWDFETLYRALKLLLERDAKESRVIRRARVQKYIKEKFDINRLVESITKA